METNHGNHNGKCVIMTFMQDVVLGYVVVQPMIGDLFTT